MKKERRKWLSLALCAAMAFTMTGLSGMVTNADDNDGLFVPTITSEPSKAKVVNLLKGDILEYADST